MKKCRRCQKDRFDYEFHKNKSKGDGLQSVCRDCRNSELREIRDPILKGIPKEKWKTINELFEARFVADPNSGCWLWFSSIDDDGYGRMKRNGKSIRAHRLSWEIHNGEIPKNSLVCHKCDNRCCVNPEHLFLGDHQENANDKVRKNRQSRTGPKNPLMGENNHLSKLNSTIVLKIRNEKGSCKRIGEKYKISSSHVHRIKNNMAWSHLKEDANGN